jgi:hypothetical protein
MAFTEADLRLLKQYLAGTFTAVIGKAQLHASVQNWQ